MQALADLTQAGTVGQVDQDLAFPGRERGQQRAVVVRFAAGGRNILDGQGRGLEPAVRTELGQDVPDEQRVVVVRFAAGGRDILDGQGRGLARLCAPSLVRTFLT